MMDTARRWLATIDRRLQGGKRQPRTDGPADAVPHDETGPRIGDDRYVDEARWQRYVRDVADPQLVGIGPSCALSVVAT